MHSESAKPVSRPINENCQPCEYAETLPKTHLLYVHVYGTLFLSQYVVGAIKAPSLEILFHNTRGPDQGLRCPTLAFPQRKIHMDTYGQTHRLFLVFTVRITSKTCFSCVLTHLTLTRKTGCLAPCGYSADNRRYILATFGDRILWPEAEFHPRSSIFT